MARPRDYCGVRWSWRSKRWVLAASAGPPHTSAIRPQAQRQQEGEIPGALLIERNVLEWRLDPASDWRIPEVDGCDREIVVVCSEGYTSSLAAASLQELGL